MTDDDVRAWAVTNDHRALAFTLMGEARGEPIEGRIAIASVIRNRAATGYRSGGSIARACFWPGQFSCWWPWGGRENYAWLMALVRAYAEGGVPPLRPYEQAIYDETVWVVEGIVSDMIRDRVRKARHYYNPKAMVPPGTIPDWIRHPIDPTKEAWTPVAIVGDHRFFAGVR